MGVRIVADKYSEAMLELAQESNTLAQLEEELTYVQDVMKEQPELTMVLTHPVMENHVKIELIDKIFSQAISTMALNFMKVMIQRNRASYIQEAIQGFITKARELRNIVEADVFVTEPLSEAAKEKLLAKLQSTLQKEVILNVTMHPHIMGGMIIQIGDKRIDASVARRLEELEKTLHNAGSTQIGVNG